MLDAGLVKVRRCCNAGLIKVSPRYDVGVVRFRSMSAAGLVKAGPR